MQAFPEDEIDTLTFAHYRLWVFLYLPEAKDRSLEEIDEMVS